MVICWVHVPIEPTMTKFSHQNSTFNSNFVMLQTQQQRSLSPSSTYDQLTEKWALAAENRSKTHCWWSNSTTHGILLFFHENCLWTTFRDAGFLWLKLLFCVWSMPCDTEALNLDSVLHYRPKLLIFILCTHSLSLVSMKLVRRRIVKRLHGQLQIYSKLFSFQSEMARILWENVYFSFYTRYCALNYIALHV